MPSPYNLDLTADQINTALNNAHDSTNQPSSGSTKLVQSGAIYSFVGAEIATHAALVKDAGSLYVSVAAASAAIATGGTYTNVLANATVADAGNTQGDITIDNTNKGIKYTGATTKLFHLHASLAFESSDSGVQVSFKFAKVGVVIDASLMTEDVGTPGTDIIHISLGPILVSLATGDYVTIHGTLSSSDSETITVDQCHMTLVAL